MATRTITIQDTLVERVESAIEDVKTELMNYLEENEPRVTPCLFNDLDCGGAIHEIVDCSVPIYTGEIEDIWYIYRRDLEAAYEGAGVGDYPRENDGMTAIYFYIMQEVQDWYADNADDIFDEWKEKQDA